MQSKKTDPAQTINPPDEEPELSSRLPAEPSANAFDVSSLPSIESIGAGTDITAFLQAGVPSALRRAALRRAWEADPAIRDFVGLNENYWNDVAGAAAAPGFGDLDPGVDVKRMVSELFGDSTPEQAETEPAPASPASADTSEHSPVQTGKLTCFEARSRPPLKCTLKVRKRPQPKLLRCTISATSHLSEAPADDTVALCRNECRGRLFLDIASGY